MNICAVLFKLNLWETEDVLKLGRDDLLRDIGVYLSWVIRLELEWS